MNARVVHGPDEKSSDEVPDPASPLGGELPAQPPGARGRRRLGSRTGSVAPVRHARIGGAQIAGAAAVVLGVALIDFIVQNTRSVRIEFFGASGRIPVSVAILAAALAGAFVVLAVGASKATLLRLKGRRSRKLGMTEGSEPPSPAP